MLPDTGIDDVKKQRHAEYAKHINDPVLSSLKMEGIRLLLHLLRLLLYFMKLSCILIFFPSWRNTPHSTTASSLLRLYNHTYLDIPHSVGLFWMSDQPEAEASIRQHTTFTRDRYSYTRGESNPQSQQTRGRRPTS
jgi:hypothetical protein